MTQDSSALQRWYEFREKLKSGDHKIAFDAGFDVAHMGGGVCAFKKDRPNNEDGYWLITDSDGTDITISPESKDWIVGHYATFAGDESWVLVSEAITLAEALELYERVPLPQPAGGSATEVVHESWAEIGIDLAHGPRS